MSYLIENSVDINSQITIEPFLRSVLEENLEGKLLFSYHHMWLLKIHISVSEWLSCNHIMADSNRQHGPSTCQRNNIWPMHLLQARNTIQTSLKGKSDIQGSFLTKEEFSDLNSSELLRKSCWLLQLTTSSIDLLPNDIVEKSIFLASIGSTGITRTYWYDLNN